MSKWLDICSLTDIVPGTGVCALVNDKQIALFRPRADEVVFAIDNMDPFAHSNVLSRGLICEHNDALWVASPLKKQRFNLTTGECLEDKTKSISAYKVKVKDGVVAVASNA